MVDVSSFIFKNKHMEGQKPGLMDRLRSIGKAKQGEDMSLAEASEEEMARKEKISYENPTDKKETEILNSVAKQGEETYQKRLAETEAGVTPIKPKEIEESEPLKKAA